MPEILKEFVSVGYILLQLTFVLTIPLCFHKRAPIHRDRSTGGQVIVGKDLMEI